MAWLWLLSAGLLEICFASFLKLSDGFSKPLFTVAFVIAAAASFFCLTRAMQGIPIGTAYAVWTGIGAAGVAILGAVLFHETMGWTRLFFLCTLLGSIIGLKLTSAS